MDKQTKNELVKIVENKPNAKGVINALKDVGYKPCEAILDLIDNAKDAQATQIFVTIIPNKKKGGKGEIGKIFIADNGYGMSMSDLDIALALGDRLSDDKTSLLGRYGMGLKVASLALGDTLKVLSKQKDDDKIYFSGHNIELQYKSQKYLGLAGKDGSKWFEDMVIKPQKQNPIYDAQGNKISVKNHGTVVCIEDCSNQIFKTVDGFAKALKSEISIVYRQLLKEGLHVYVQQSEVTPVKYVEFEGTKLLHEIIETVNGYDVKVSLYEVGEVVVDQSYKTLKENALSLCGFSFKRNKREVMRGETMGLFNKHQVANRLRGEVEFTGHNDEMFGITFSKHGVRPDSDFIERIRPILQSAITDATQRYSKSRRTKKVAELESSAVKAEEAFEKSASSLMGAPEENAESHNWKNKVVKRIIDDGVKTKKNKQCQKATMEKAPILPEFVRKQVKNLNDLVRKAVPHAKLLFYEGAEHGNIFNAKYEERGTIVTEINSNHPYNSIDPDILKLLWPMCFNTCYLGAEPGSDEQRAYDKLMSMLNFNLTQLIIAINS